MKTNDKFINLNKLKEIPVKEIQEDIHDLCHEWAYNQLKGFVDYEDDFFYPSGFFYYLFNKQDKYSDNETNLLDYLVVKGISNKIDNDEYNEICKYIEELTTGEVECVCEFANASKKDSMD